MSDVGLKLNLQIVTAQDHSLHILRGQGVLTEMKTHVDMIVLIICVYNYYSFGRLSNCGYDVYILVVMT